jgi:NDP-sugar pyrophosphorylase family protein
MKAFVLGAGLGTRLRPLTERRPKPLVPLYGKPLITFAFDHLIAGGISSFVINTHHCPEAYVQLLGGNQYRGMPVEYRHEPVLLDTGGGIKNIETFIGEEPFIACNGDILADFPIRPVIESHLRSDNLATMILRSSGGPLHVQSRDGLVTDIRGTLGNASDPSFLFTGITILSPEIFRYIPAGKVASIIPIYLDLISAGEKIGAAIVDEGLWLDLGTREAYLAAHELLQPGGLVLSHASKSWPVAVEPGSRISPSASLDGACAVGAGATVGADAVLEDCVLWENAIVAPGSRLARCVVRDGVEASGIFRDRDF